MIYCQMLDPKYHVPHNNRSGSSIKYSGLTWNGINPEPDVLYRYVDIPFEIFSRSHDCADGRAANPQVPGILSSITSIENLASSNRLAMDGHKSR